MKNKKSFTLIELLMVLTIIGILLAMIIVSLNDVRARARDVKRISDARTILQAVTMYGLDHDTYYITNKDGSPTGYNYSGFNYSNGWINVTTTEQSSYPAKSILEALTSWEYMPVTKDPFFGAQELNTYPYDHMYYQTSQNGPVPPAVITPLTQAKFNIFVHLERPGKLGIDGYDIRSAPCYKTDGCDNWRDDYLMNYRIGN